MEAMGLSPASPMQAHTLWRTADTPATARFDAWADLVSDTFLPWSMVKRPSSTYDAQISQRRLDGYRLINCTCDPFEGQRGIGELAKTSEDCYCLLFIASGREHMRVGHKEVLLDTGDFVLWDSERKMTFSVVERLRKLTLVIPRGRLEAVLPFAKDYVGIAVNGRTGSGALFAAYLQALDREFLTIKPVGFRGVMHATLELLAQSYQTAQMVEPQSLRTMTLERIRQYILEHLADDQLCPATIASAHRLSVRYLHLLFEASGITMGTWILQQRLERCRHLLICPEGAHHPISHIALNCGFKDAGHFGKVFKKAFGMSPRDFREHHLGIGRNAEFGQRGSVPNLLSIVPPDLDTG